ncbi:MAG: efflux RND transporter periplasmic adaptor subunit [Acidovorax sp.]
MSNEFSKARFLGVSVVALAVVGGAAFYAAQSARSAEKDKVPRQAPPVPVHTAIAQQRDMPIAMTGMGTVVPVASVTVRTRVDGQLDKVEFKEGQDVKTGQVLARLDARTFEAQLQQAQAQKAKDEALLANARADLARYSELIKDEATTRQTLDTQKALVRQLEAAVQNDAAQVNYAKVQLGFTTISAPISGRIGARLVDPGNIVHAADANGLLVVNQIDPIAVQFTLPQERFQAVNQAINDAKGKPLPVQALDAVTGAVLATGELTLLNNAIDVSTGTISMKARFANPQHKLWPGQAATARLLLGTQQGAVVVPSSAVQRGAKGLFAYVVDAEGKAQMQPVTVSSTANAESVISSGLQAGQKVIRDGQVRVTPGAAVVDAKDAAKDAKAGSGA